MKKDEYIERYGQVAYEKRQQQNQEWQRAHPERINARNRERYKKTPELNRERAKEHNRRTGKHYHTRQYYKTHGIPRNRERVRLAHGRRWRQYKKIIAPGSELHHQWLPDSADYRGVALVEKAPHQHGFVDVIQILEGEITLLTEKEIREYTGEKK